MTTSETKLCPFCGEEIKAVAIKCKHCGERLDGGTPLPGNTPRPAARGVATVPDVAIHGGTLNPDRTVNRYRLKGLLGAGGMGEVYQAEHQYTGQIVAIKAVWPNLMAEQNARARFLLEGRTLGGLKHPNIVGLQDFFEEGGRFFLVMEYIEGVTLDAMLRQKREQGAPLELNGVARILTGVLEALAHAHGQAPAVVHRDIKPSNVMLARDGRAVLMDFGIAKVIGGEKLTRTRGVVGTYEYMSPEQVQGGEITPAADVYAVGIMAFEMLAGRVPFPQTTDSGMEVMKGHVELPVPELRSLRPDCPEWLLKVVYRALAKTPGYRFADAGEMLAALKADSGAAAVVPSSASPASVPSLDEGRMPSPTTGQTASSAENGGSSTRGAVEDVPMPVRGGDEASEVRESGRGWKMGLGLVLACVLAAIGLAVGVAASKRGGDTAIVRESESEAAMQAKAESLNSETSRLRAEAERLKGETARLEAERAAAEEARKAEEARRAEEARKAAAEKEKSLQGKKALVEWGRRVKAMTWVHSKPASLDFTKTEVTVAQYGACVDSGKCDSGHHRTRSDSGTCNWGHSDRGEHPMNCVNWYGASAFCEAVGGRLPTEKEWHAEASKGGKRKYPWGGKAVSCHLAVWGDGHKTDGCGKNSTWPVCSKTAGNSVSGPCDMSGNVWEWTSSEKGSARVLRGGGWNSDEPGYLRASARFEGVPDSRLNNVGFRCVRSSRKVGKEGAPTAGGTKRAALPKSACERYSACCFAYAKALSNVQGMPPEAVEATKEGCAQIKEMKAMGAGADEACTAALDAMRQAGVAYAQMPGFVWPDACR